jgi:hypothetical protein
MADHVCGMAIELLIEYALYIIPVTSYYMSFFMNTIPSKYR